MADKHTVSPSGTLDSEPTGSAVTGTTPSPKNERIAAIMYARRLSTIVAQLRLQRATYPVAPTA